MGRDDASPPLAASPSRLRILGWGVHAFTASGLLFAAGVVSLLIQPDRTPDTYRYCFLLMLAAVLIDAVDGTMARAVRIKETIPEFDGRRLDDLVDYLLYTCLPLLLIDRAGLLPDGTRWVLVLALVASTYGFCQTDIKTADGAFLGFPSYWNIVAFYLYAVPVTGYAAVAIILALAFLTFVPSRCPYTTQPGRLNRWLLAGCVPWVALVLVVLLQPWDKERQRWAVWASAAYPVLYLGVAWGMSLWRMKAHP